MLKKSTLREIKQSFGRYISILLIIALGVGFFSGLKVAKDGMIETADAYLEQTDLYDFKLISTLGYDNRSLSTIRSADGVTEAEGSISYDVITIDKDDNERVSCAMSVTENINIPKLKEGRMPEKADECVVDSHSPEGGKIGQFVRLSGNNSEETLDNFRYKKYKIVGKVTSPVYLNYERGSTELGSGQISSFFCIPKEGFKSSTFTEIYACVEKSSAGFDKEYDKAVDRSEKDVKKAARRATGDRYDSLTGKARRILAEKRTQFEKGLQLYRLQFYASTGLQTMTDEDLPQELLEAKQKLEQAEKKLDEADKGKTYILDRSMNTGYATFESNADIVSSIAKIFPVFFFLVAALVCMTTMTRMVDEQRTQMGVLRALGYRRGSVLAKYLFYSGSAGLIGAVSGFFFGCWLFPTVIWKAYGMMYDFDPHIAFVFDPLLFVLSIAAALICSMGVTWATCLNEFRSMPAELIRPKAPKPGKRILLERFPLLWDRFSFLVKVSLRNIFRYKKRFFMMVIGISGCTALLIAGYGIDTSVSNIAEYQFSEIDKYDYTVSFDKNMTESDQKSFRTSHKGMDRILFLSQQSCDLEGEGVSRSVTLVTSSSDEFGDFVRLHRGDKKISAPEKGNAVICRRLQKHYGVERGDKVTLTIGRKNMEVTVSDVCDNYIYDYVYINDETYEAGFGNAPKQKTAYVCCPDDMSAKAIRKQASKVMNEKHVSGVNVNLDMEDRLDDMMKSLDAVVLLVILSAGALAFIVIYNLTNINITERIREIATIKVLGFRYGETASYVYRENFMLAACGALAGLPLGTWLLHFVISKINVDLVFFEPRISLFDYAMSVVLTFVFTGVVAAVMYRKLRKVSMTESLKAIE